jgi:hypothetical protein
MMQDIIHRFRLHGLVVFFLTLAVVISGTAEAQQTSETKTVVVVGSGPIYGGNVQAARQTAIKESLVTAVAQMTAEILQPDALMENFALINSTVYAQTDKYIQDYKVLTETTSDKSYRVMVQATVAAKKIAEELSKEGILRAQTILPSVLFLIAEQNVNEFLPQYWWANGMGNFQSVCEQAIDEIFLQKGFAVVDHRGVRLQEMEGWAADAGFELTDRQAADLGAWLKADVVVLGTSRAAASANTMGYDKKSFVGTFTARVLRTETGEEMFSVSRTAVTASVDEVEGGKDALARVGTEAGEALAEQLAAEWQKLKSKPSQVEIMVEGTGKLANFVRFRKALSSISGVEGIRVKEIQPDKTTLMVDFRGQAKDLASDLMLKTFEDFGLDIYEVTENSLKIALVAR